MAKIDVASGDPYRADGGKFGTSPDQKLEAALAAMAGKTFVPHDDNKKKIASLKGEAQAKLAALRGDAGGGSGLLTEAQAKEATKDSALAGVPFYHGTSGKAAEGIKTDGFKVGKSGEDRFGSGVYFSQDAILAQSYATGKDKPTTVVSYIDAKKVHDEVAKQKSKDTGSINARVTAKLKAQKIVINSDWDVMKNFSAYKKAYQESVNDIFTKDGVDAIRIPADNKQPEFLIVRDPSLIKPFKIDDAKKIGDDFFKKLSK